MAIPFVQVDAFTDRPFAGNPAAVCFLDGPADAGWMQAVAAEMNLAETAFVVPLAEADAGREARTHEVDIHARYGLRWFTPTVEVDLCGHATLATAHALWSEGRAPSGSTLRFETRSGELTAQRTGELIRLDFPAAPAAACEPPAGLLEALGVEGTFVGRNAFDYLVVVDDETVVRSLSPDLRALTDISTRGVMVTARSDGGYDFVSRFFAPGAGIDEDPVTGSAHCCLGPYWAGVTGKSELVGYQASARGEIVRVQVGAERVALDGSAVTVVRGEVV
ncbi:MAG: PhzF family phenazine biosynthesis protein [Spirochaetota bacterium]